MIRTSYAVTVCDKSPIEFMGSVNYNVYKFASWHKAKKFMEESLSQGHFVVVNSYDVESYGFTDLITVQEE